MASRRRSKSRRKSRRQSKSSKNRSAVHSRMSSADPGSFAAMFAQAGGKRRRRTRKSRK